MMELTGERKRNAEAKKAARMAKRAANREAWANDQRNANVQIDQRRKATVEIPVEPAGEADSGSLGKLRGIMADRAEPLYRRIDAAETVLSYELAPGSLTSVAADQVAVDQVAATSYRFLQAVIEEAETPAALRFRALKSLAAIENARASRTNATTNTMRREFWVARINGARRTALIEAGLWNSVVAASAAWALQPVDVFEIPELPKVGMCRIAEDGSGIAARMYELTSLPDHAMQAHGEAVDAQLRAVRATNRTDRWDRLLPAGDGL